MKLTLKKGADIAAVAEYLFSPQHAFILRAAADLPPRFTAHMLCRSIDSDRPELVNFVLSDLVSAELVDVKDGLFSIAPLAAVQQAVERIAH